MREITLASASPRRKDLLKQIGLEFNVITSNVDEDIQDYTSPEDLVEKLSYIKAEDVAKCTKKGIIIGADTVVVHNDKILGKPTNEEDAKIMLKALSGDSHRVITGITVLDVENEKCITTHVKTIVNFKKLSLAALEGYVASNEPFDKAGSYGIQGLGAVLVEKIEGCYFNVVGLPISRLAEVLKEFGITVL
jgi:septum formation protein